MGADTFFNKQSGPNAREAFTLAVHAAQYDYGHAGYTGTIAEKQSFKMITLPEGEDPYDYAHQLIDNEDRRIDDKWGPAGCFDLGPDPEQEGMRVYFFFGWASS